MGVEIYANTDKTILDPLIKLNNKLLPILQFKHSRVQLDEMQFGFRPGRGTTDAIFIVRQLQEKYLGKKERVVDGVP